MENFTSLKSFFFNRKHSADNNINPGSPHLLSSLKGKITTPEDSLSAVKPGDRVFVGTGCAMPGTLVKTLENLDKSLDDVKLYHFMTGSGIPIRDGLPATRFFHTTFFVDHDMQKVIQQGQGEYIPLSIAQIPRLLKNGGLHIDVALIQVAMPDQYGYVNTGGFCGITHAMIRYADIVIAELNPNMPKTFGDTAISVDQIDKAIVVDTPVIEHQYPSLKPDIAERIAYHISRIIDDGSTLQIGHGRIPNGMLKYLTGRKDLGIHTDLITDGVVDLIEKKIINGKEKTLHTGKIVASYCSGTSRLYNMINNNPLFSFHPIDYVCDPSIIRRNNKFVSITQAQSIDLMGQVCSDQFKGELYSGVSTQPEFIRGAASAPDGRPIICLESTTRNGKESRILPLFQKGEGVTIPCADVHYVVTECGTAYLFGKSLQEKALALIEIAHPLFRPWLLQEAKRLKYLPTAQELKCMGDREKECLYPIAENKTLELKNSTRIVVRPAKASDVKGLQDLFYKLPPKDVYTRFFSNLKRMSISNAGYFCNVDYENEMAFVATTGDREQEKIIGSAFYVVDPLTNTAEVAYMILHEWHGMGLGTALQQRMTTYAISKGLKGFTADILPENKAMLKLAQKCSAKVETQRTRDMYKVKIAF